MLHGISYKAIDNNAMQEAIKNNASKDHISSLKQTVAYNATVGFEYSEEPFSSLSAILCNDYAFNPFKYKTIEEGAVYNATAYPNPTGRIRGRANTTGKCSWVCLDVDDTNITDIECHTILGNINHHIARTSDEDNAYKYRIIIPLTEAIEVDNAHWKPFITAISNYLQCKTDNLPKSQLFIGYNNRVVYTKSNGEDLDPMPHLFLARTKVAALEEKRALQIPKAQADEALQKPYSTFRRGYEAEDGEGSTRLISCLHQAHELGATREYMIDLVNAINSYWQTPMPQHRIQSTIIGYINGLS